MAVYKHIFSPIKIGRLTVKNRIETAPANPFLATGEGFVGPDLIEYVRALAKGGAGIVTMGDTSILHDPDKKFGHTLNLGTDKCINGLYRMVETIQRYDAKASIELSLQANYSPNDLTLEQIKLIIDSYANAALRCLQAGMDMIMVHGAHGHLISQFLSTQSNLRTDGFGGSLINRARFAIEILDAIREKVGDKLAIEYRISADELVSGGLTVEEQLEFARVIQDKIDLLHVSAGKLYAPETVPMMIQPTYVQRGVNVHFAELFKKELKVPITTVGSINMEIAEQIVAEDKADMVAMIRTFLADPNCISKARMGQTEKIRPCVRCNTCIEIVHLPYHLPIRCAVNPILGRAAEFVNLPAVTQMKKVVVIGGGPAGMEASRTAAERGHDVVLFEKDDKLGGALNFASALPFKADMKNYLDWAVRTTMNTVNLKVNISTEATTEIIKAENPDVLIIAVGSSPIIPNLPGIDGENVIWAGNVDTGNVKVGDRVVLAGAGLTGSETALFLAEKGKKVTIIDMQNLEQIDQGIPFINIIKLRSMLKLYNVEVITGVKLEGVTDMGAIVLDKNLNRREIPCDTVVLSLGVKPREEVVQLFNGLAPEVHVIGDCHTERGNLWNATNNGFNAAIEI